MLHAKMFRMTLISVTRLRVRSAWYLPGFLFLALRSARQSNRAEGNAATKVLRDAKRAFWTCTAWTNEAAMKEFMLAGPHRRAMMKLANWCDEASVVHWKQADAALPDWHEAHRRMVAEGRPSKVNNPSPAHAKLDIPLPNAR